MDFITNIVSYVVENLPAIAAAGYAAVMAFKANKRAKSVTGDSKIQIKCRKLVSSDITAMMNYHENEIKRLQSVYDYLYDEENNNNGNS